MRAAPSRLSGAEMAEAAVLADLAVALLFLGWMLPVGQVLQILSVVPQAAVAYRHRLRVVVASGAASSSVGFLLGGVNLWSIALVVATMGAISGSALRRGWGRGRILALGLGMWAVVAGLTVGQLSIFASFRKLAFDQIRNSWHGVRRVGNGVATWVPGLHPVLHAGDRVVNSVIGYWYIAIPAGELFFLELILLLSARVSRRTLRSLDRALGPPPPLPAAAREPAEGHPPAPQPVPVRLADVAYRYPERDEYALAGVDLELPAGVYAAVVGTNGSGKSTLARVVAGMLDPEGTVSRPGPVGLGQPGGTAVIFQRPESQVLGARVGDDLVWGMTPGAARGLDVDGLLERVGLAGLADAETSTLSGGQLQRLAIAAALARRPGLLVSDESTSMLDPRSRRQVAELLVSLPERDGVTVLHVTHRPEEAAAAGVTVEVDGGAVARR